MIRDTRRTAMGWGSYQVNERRRTNRYYLQLPMSHEVIYGGWSAFHAVAKVLRQHCVRPDRIAYLRHTVTPIGITTVFEVLP